MAITEPESFFDIDESPELEARLDAEAEAAYAAGKFVSHERVVEWLKSWGTKNELPRPKP